MTISIIIRLTMSPPPAFFKMEGESMKNAEEEEEEEDCLDADPHPPIDAMPRHNRSEMIGWKWSKYS